MGDKELEPVATLPEAKTPLAYDIRLAHYFHSKGRSTKEEPDMIRLTLDMDRKTWRRVRNFISKEAQ